MPYPLPLHTASPRSIARRLPAIATLSAAARSSISAAAAGAGALAAGAVLLLTPRPADAMAGGDLYESCLQAVDGLARRCLDGSDTWVGDFACMWAGGVGYIGCAVIEAIRQLLPGGFPAQ